jgi:hypothetical protein
MGLQSRKLAEESFARENLASKFVYVIESIKR